MLHVQDMSPLENMHVASSFQIMYGTEKLNFKFVDHLDMDSRNILRASMIDLILGELSALLVWHFICNLRNSVPTAFFMLRLPSLLRSYPTMGPTL